MLNEDLYMTTTEQLMSLVRAAFNEKVMTISSEILIRLKGFLVVKDLDLTKKDNPVKTQKKKLTKECMMIQYFQTVTSNRI